MASGDKAQTFIINISAKNRPRLTSPENSINNIDSGRESCVTNYSFLITQYGPAAGNLYNLSIIASYIYLIQNLL